MLALPRKGRGLTRKETVYNVIKTFKSLVERQKDKEVRAIYRSGPYRLSDRYKRFEVDSVKWHSMDPQAQMKHAKRFWRYRPALDDQFDKLKLSGRKLRDRKRTRKTDFESAFDRLVKKGKGKQENVYLPEFQRPGKEIEWIIIPFNGKALG